MFWGVSRGSQLAKGTCTSVEAHITQDDKLHDGLIQQSKEPVLQHNRQSFTGNKKKLTLGRPSRHFQLSFSTKFYGYQLHFEKPLVNLLSVLGRADYSRDQETQNLSMLQSAMPLARKKAAPAKRRRRSSTQAHADLLCTVMMCCAFTV